MCVRVLLFCVCVRVYVCVWSFWLVYIVLRAASYVCVLQEMALMQQRATKELLANRITELEAEVQRLKGGVSS